MQPIEILALFALSALIGGFFGANRGHTRNKKITGLELKACNVALTAYEKTKPEPDINHCAIWIEDRNKAFRINFIPNSKPNAPPSMGRPSNSIRQALQDFATSPQTPC